MRIAILFVAGAILAVLALEMFLSAMPVSTGYRFRDVDAANPILRGPAYGKYTYSRGWDMRLARTGRMNGDGLPAGFDYLENVPTVVVVGDSFIQAAALEPPERMQERLHRAPGFDRQVAAIGQSGAGAPDHIAALRWARERWAIDAALVVLVEGDIASSTLPKSGGHHFTIENGAVTGPHLTARAAPRGLWALANRSRLLRWLYDNLAIASRIPAPAALFRSHAPERPVAGGRADAAPALDPLYRTEIENLARAFLARLPAAIGLPPERIILTIDADRPLLRQDRSYGSRDIDILAALAREAGFVVIDLDGPFRAAGPPVDFLPLDGHWNARAHALVADAVRAALPAAQRRE
jgi:hypothetical protein